MKGVGGGVLYHLYVQFNIPPLIYKVCLLLEALQVPRPVIHNSL